MHTVLHALETLVGLLSAVLKPAAGDEQRKHTSLDSLPPSLVEHMLGVGQPRLGPNHHGHLQLVGALSPGERRLQVLRHLQRRAADVQ